jgi:hypothetical protein
LGLDDGGGWAPGPISSLLACGTAQADGEETSEVGWWAPAEIERDLDINNFTRAMLRDVGVLATQTR